MLISKFLKNTELLVKLPNILVFLITASLFIDINFFTLGSFIISTKFLAVILGTLIMLIDLKVININLYLIKYAIIFYFIFNISRFSMGSFELPSFIYFMSYAIFLTVFLNYLSRRRLNNFFLQSFVFVCSITSIIAILQVFNFLPTVTSSVENNVLDVYSLNQGDIFGGSFNRGRGLMFDSNFFGMTLAIGFAINRFYKKSLFASILIFLGVLSTFSRSALLALIFSYIFTLSMLKFNAKKIVKFFTIATLIIALIFILSFIFPSSILTYFVNRVLELFNFTSIFNPSINDFNLLESSTSIRIFSLLAAYYIFLSNPLFGTGIEGSRIAFQEYLGTSTVAHNTFIEFFVVSGIFGIIPTILFLQIFFSKSNLNASYLKKFRAIAGPLLISFLTLTHMQSLLLFYPLFFKKLISNMQTSDEH